MNGNYRNYTIFMQKKYWIEREREIWEDNSIYSIKNYEYVEMIKGFYGEIKKTLEKISKKDKIK